MGRSSERMFMELRRMVFERDGWTCQDCRVLCMPKDDAERSGRYAPLGRSKSGREVWLEVDHIHPVSLGGSDDLANVRAACCDCNRKKGTSTHLVDWPGRFEIAVAILTHGPATRHAAELAVKALMGQGVRMPGGGARRA